MKLNKKLYYLINCEIIFKKIALIYFGERFIVLNETRSKSFSL